MHAEERQPLPEDWSHIRGNGGAETDAVMVALLQERAALRSVANVLVTPEDDSERLSDQALAIEYRIRNAACASNIGAAVKLILIEEGLEEGFCTDDARLLRHTILHLLGQL